MSVNRDVGVAKSARAAGVSKACISRVVNGLSRTSNSLVHLAIKKYVRVVELPDDNIETELTRLGEQYANNQRG